MKQLSKRVAGAPLTAEQRAQLEKVAKLPDSEIDTSDAPELPESVWKDAVRGRF